MKKIFSLLAIASMLFNTSAFAQITPEGVMATLPDMPTVAQMIAYETGEQDPELYSDFLTKLDVAERQSQKMVEKSIGHIAHDIKSATMKQKVAGTNVTTAQVMNMSKAEREKFAKTTSINEKLSSMGISMEELQAVQSGKMSEEELASKMMAKQTGGLTTKDIQAMQNMTEAERIEFMQQSGLAKSTQAAAAKNKKAVASNAALTSVIQKITSLSGRITELMQKSIRLRDEANASGADLYAKNYKGRIETLQEECRALSVFVGGGEDGTAAEEAKAREAGIKIAAINKQIDGFRHDFYSKSIPVWRNAVIASMDVFRVEVLPLQYELKEAYAKAYVLTKNPEYMGGEQFPFQAAFAYLEAAEYIDDYNFTREE